MSAARNGKLKANDSEEQFTVKHNGQTYDITRFLQFHPGGRNSVSSYRGQSITEKFLDTKHSPAASYLMKEYRIAGQPQDSTAEDLERLVDWSKPMLHQVGKLGPNYKAWVSAPVDRELRLFAWDILEYMTVTPWYLIPIVWVPVAMFFIYHGWLTNQQDINEGLGLVWALFNIVTGIVMWSFLEYSVHRWVFHLQPPATSSVLITFHFMIHGLHHKVPFDGRRLLFPPVPAAMVGLVLYSIYTAIFPQWMVSFMTAGTIIGYIAYDLTHFYLHHGSPEEGSHLYYMKRYHNQHHFTHYETGFGISSSFWDKIFGTEIVLRKLGRALKW